MHSLMFVCSKALNCLAAMLVDISSVTLFVLVKHFDFLQIITVQRKKSPIAQDQCILLPG